MAGKTEQTISNEEYTLRKRLPNKLPKRKNDVYVNNRSDFAGQLARCQRMLDSEYTMIYIHGLGAAASTAINLALQLQLRGMGAIQVAAHTSTVKLIDDLEPETEDLDASCQTRNNSAVHIKVFRTVSFVTNHNATPTAVGY